MISPSGQELALSHLGLRDYLLFAPRNSLIGANKEGIISLSGKKNRKCRYSKLKLSSFQAISPSSFWGCLLAPHSPSFFCRRQEMLINKDYKRRNSLFL